MSTTINTSVPHSLSQNYLFKALPVHELEQLRPNLELMSLPLGTVLYESGCKLSHVYFPTTAIVSLLYITENGSSTEIAIVGNEGLIGLALFMGGETMPNTSVVQSGGFAYRMKGDLLKRAFNSSIAIRHLFLRYTQALITQMTQTAVCNRHHSIEQQLCRWLLLSFDRLSSNELIMTQELISNMLGVRREGITEAARKLQNAGLIEYHRGHITLLDRLELEHAVCECYQVVKEEYDRLLPDKSPFNQPHQEIKKPLTRRSLI
ncbi:cAMP-binding domain of CRP or a regulatory subunit of cAMP-dependent protein kinases [Nitrosomonas cryotolerans]|uniref:cAMP-binding domain of CRP or a regulatory subunit of cAMP-dependent protein kinases n=1 Tax=Nitrosomonas cryotolerans ATCC 49181 TaxID=1131553 RepID=A0A1N6GCJ1_9PROT|nr:Crp/Fnr family transcriptional regulator [Nitrosomonas cryotolerans]SFQ04441.1 cAMP-binding domain of CRP or a regulatory subunit of cAMP-dependent protein kinases [Nitrosomonas cryotolerans]SIO05152.1 cAMP-binding domain of CRP or a regulatory subunit of cAMP-dependent protein kinases [Nitrosomonas cryotolerans ATCC 49181]